MGVDISTYRRRIGAHYGRGWRTTVSRDSRPAKPSSNKWHFDGPGYEGTTPGCRFPRFSRPHARFGLLAAMFLSCIVLACATQPDSSSKNLHDLSPLLLRGGDIEENPGPSTAVQTEPELTEQTTSLRNQENPRHNEILTLWEEKFRALEQKTDKKLAKLERELENQKDFSYRLSEICEHHCTYLENEHNQLQIEIQTLEESQKGIAYDMENRIRLTNDQADKHEQILKRNNIKMFGVPERDREPYRECLDTVLQLFREAAPGVPWSEKDIIKVQRLGAPRRNANHSRPRPLLVEITTFFDKLILLKYGREVLRRKGVSIASELTTRQTKILQDLREEGHDAYFWNNKLWFRDRLPSQTAPRSTASRNQSSRRMQGNTSRFPLPTTRGPARSSEHGTFPQDRYTEEWEQPVYPQQHFRTDHAEPGGTWAHPDHYGRFQTTVDNTEAYSMRQNRQVQSGIGETTTRTRHHSRSKSAAKERTQQSSVPPRVPGTRPDRWLQLRQDYHSKQCLQSSKDSESTSCMNYFTEDELSTDDFSVQESSLGRHLNSAPDHLSEGGESFKSVGLQMREGCAAIDRKNRQQRESQQRECQPAPSQTSQPKTQTTVLDWLTRKSAGADHAVDTPPSPGTQRARQRNVDNAAASEAASPWRGRLRQRQSGPNNEPSNDEF